MRHLLVAALVVAAGLLPSARAQDASSPDVPSPPGRDQRIALASGGASREYVVHVPRGFDGKRALPVVLMFHGGGGTAEAAITETGWTKKADEAGFLAVFPEATRPDPARPARFKENQQIWNDGSGRFFAGKRNVDDVGFVRAVLDDLAVRFPVDRRRVFACGFSNGSSMTFRVGEELSEQIAAIAPVAGACWNAVPAPRRAVPCLYVSGTADPLNPMDGGEVIGGRAKPPVRENVLRWARATGCPEDAKVVIDKNGVKGVRFGPGHYGCEVLFYTVEGMGHTWAGGRSLLPESMVGRTSDKLSATDLAWEFFSRHALPHAVGYRTADVEGLAVAVWHPTEATPAPFSYGPGAATGSVAKDAAPAPGRWPLVVFSHGFGGGGTGQTAIAEAIAARGFVVAAPDHRDAVTTVRIRGEAEGDFDAVRRHLNAHPFDRQAYAYRPAEVRAVLDAMLASKEFGIDTAKVALAGHSMGGWSVMTVALADERIGAIVLWSMGELNWLAGRRCFEMDELHKLRGPSLFIYGSDEAALNPRGVYATYCFDAAPAPSYLVGIDGGNHFSYCDRAVAPRAGGTDAQTTAVARATIAFLERHVRGADVRLDAVQTKERGGAGR